MAAAARSATQPYIYIYTYVHSIYTSLEPTSVLVGLPLNIISSFSFFFRVSKRKEEERTKGKEKKKNKKKETKIILISFLLVSGRVLERGG
jgi:hypothetical protein